MVNKADVYLRETLLEILEEGCLDNNVRALYEDGAPAISQFITHKTFNYDLQKGEYPLPSLRNTAVRTGIREMLWIYQKQSNELSVADSLSVKWWNLWNIGDGTIGRRYGATVKKYGIIETVLSDLETLKFSRRHIIDLYQYNDFKETKGLHPCVFLSMFAVREIEGVNYLDLMLVSRSSDFVVAGFINQSQYVGLLMMIVGHLNTVTNEAWERGKFTFVGNNLHCYLRNFDALGEILDRKSLGIQPTMKLKENKNFFDYVIEDFEFSGLEKTEKLKNKLHLAI